jgi:hypothetical protein
MPLRETQKALERWIRAPEGVAPALEAEDRSIPGHPSGAARRHLESLIRGDHTLESVERLEIYANAYFQRIHGVLANDYPALQSALGRDLFRDLVTSYLLVEPSRHPSLRFAGARLPDFLAAHEAAAGLRQRAPWAPDLAAFEWARVEVFDAADHGVFERNDLVGVEPEAFAALPMKLGGWVLLCGLDHPVDEIWRDRARGEARDPSLSPLVTRSRTELIVWRRHEGVRHRRVAPREQAALARVRSGIEFADLCEWAAHEVGDEDAPALAASWLELWLADGLLQRLD